MVIELSNITPAEVNGLRNGQGKAMVRKVVEETKTFLEITLVPGSTIGLHTHEEDEELIYVIKGTGINIEKGQTYRIQAGSIIYIKNKESHQIVNNSDDELVILGIIQK